MHGGYALYDVKVSLEGGSAAYRKANLSFLSLLLASLIYILVPPMHIIWAKLSDYKDPPHQGVQMPGCDTIIGQTVNKVDTAMLANNYPSITPVSYHLNI